MTRSTRAPSLALALALPLALAVPATAASPGELCGSAKLKATAAYVPKLLSCAAKAAKKGLAVDATCLAGAEALLDKKHLPQDAAPECVFQRDTAATRAAVAAYVADLHTAFGTDADPLALSKCDAARIGQVGAAAKSQLGAYAGALKKPAPAALGTKLAKAAAKLASGLAKAEASADCSAVVDAAALGADLEAFVASLVSLGQVTSQGAAVVASPRAFHTNTATEVRIEARVPVSLGEKIKSVAAYPLVATGYAAGPLVCALLDNGDLANGDDIAGDRVFSCLLDVNDAQPTARTLGVLVVAKGASSVSSPFQIRTVDPLTQAQAQAVVDVQAQVAAIWQTQLGVLGDTLAARQAAAADVANLAGVVGSGVSPDDLTLWYLLDSGVRGGLMLSPPGTRGGRGASAAGASAPASVAPARFPEPRTRPRGAGAIDVESNRVLVFDAFNDEFEPFDEGLAIRDLYQASTCPLFEVDYLANGLADVNAVLRFTDYGTIVLVTHGAVDGDGEVVFLTRQPVTVQGVMSADVYLLLQELTVMSGVFAVRPEFVRNLPGFFENSIVYAGSCNSSRNPTLADAFLDRGAESFFGFDEVVHSDFAEGAANQLFTELAGDFDTTGVAFAAVAPQTDPTAPNASLTHAGDAALAHTRDLRNVGFEAGGLSGWVRDGDGRVIQKLGAFAPTAGDFMGIISTGLGFTTASGAIEQGFCLDPAAQTLSFDWNFSSEELVEYCFSIYDDPFVVEMVVNPGAFDEQSMELFREDVDTVCDEVQPTNLYFDQAVPGCVSSGTTVGGGGNDCTVHSTGWRHEDLDISAIAAAQGGEPVVIRFSNTDSADSIFDSAVLLDQIEVRTTP